MARFTDIFDDVTKQGRKIPTNEYLERGMHPIIDQGQKEIAGYSNEEAGLFCDVPAIIFGDHTRVIKYVDTPCFLGADGVKLLKAKKSNANYKYLFYALSSADIPNTGYNRHFKWLKEVEIPTHTENEQNDIVAVLDKVSGLIALRKQQLQKLDELVKARFVELFDGKYATKTLESVCEELFAGGDVKKDISSDVQSEEHPYPIYTNGEKNNGLYGYTSKARVTKEAVTISGRGTIGFTCLRKEPFYPAVRLIVAVPNQELVSGCYLQHFVQSKNYGGQGASIPQLTVPMIKDEPIPVPPIELQNQFAAFVEQTDKSKLTVQQSLDKLEILKKSLMQKYFG